jgi:hypothetical protein
MINGEQNRFNQLLNSIEEGNPKTLSTRLREMEKSVLIKRLIKRKSQLKSPSIATHFGYDGCIFYEILYQRCFQRCKATRLQRNLWKRCCKDSTIKLRTTTHIEHFQTVHYPSFFLLASNNLPA